MKDNFRLLGIVSSIVFLFYSNINNRKLTINITLIELMAISITVVVIDQAVKDIKRKR